MVATPAIEHYDVAVVGGGPAGAALATLLQRQGHECVILESSPFPRYHIGESLIPNSYGVLDRLGLIPRLQEAHFPRKYSVRFVSPTGEETHPFYYFEAVRGDRAQTWQVDRSEFDALCLENARDSGVLVRSRARVDGILFEGEQAVGVQARLSTGRTCEMRARVVVDASGRATVIGSQLGLKQPIPGLNKTALWSYYRGGLRLPGIDAGETTVFILPRRGWFWYIPLPNDLVSVGIVADPDYLFDEGDDFTEVFLREVWRCEPLRLRLESATRSSHVRGYRRLAYRNQAFAGNGWVMVGDAAAFLDPIHSAGLFLALTSAEMAAGCVHDALESGDTTAERLGAFTSPLTQGVEVIRRLIHAFYDPAFSFREFVDRFPDQKADLIDCLVGDVFNRNLTALLGALATMTPPPPL